MKYELTNYMEVVVKDKLEELIDNGDVCKCEQCKKDIMALVLNDLPPRYIVTQKGEVYSKINSLFLQFSTDVTSSIIKAMDKVKKYPRH